MPHSLAFAGSCTLRAYLTRTRLFSQCFFLTPVHISAGVLCMEICQSQLPHFPLAPTFTHSLACTVLFYFVSTKQIPIQAGSLSHTCFLLQPHTCHSCKSSLWNPSFFATFSHLLSAPFYIVSLLPFLGLIHMLFTVTYFLSTYIL